MSDNEYGEGGEEYEDGGGEDYGDGEPEEEGGEEYYEQEEREDEDEDEEEEKEHEEQGDLELQDAEDEEEEAEPEEEEEDLESVDEEEEEAEDEEEPEEQDDEEEAEEEDEASFTSAPGDGEEAEPEPEEEEEEVEEEPEPEEEAQEEEEQPADEQQGEEQNEGDYDAYRGEEFAGYDEPQHYEEPATEPDDVLAAVTKGDLNSIHEDAPPMAAPTGEDGGEKVNFASMFKGVMDGFGGGSMNDIIGEIKNISGGGGGGAGGGGGGMGGMLTSLLSSGAIGSMVEKGIASAASRFLHVNPETGALLGAIAGNLIFHTGGQNNSLGGIGKTILENIMNGKFRRDERRLFEDPEFPAGDRALYFKERPRAEVEWKRPGDICESPQLIMEGHSRFDVMQGALGDCWLLAAVANLTLRDELFYRVVPPDQSFTENYAGIFHFQFWRYGRWVDVVIDDRLPTVNGKLYYMHSEENNVFWSALLEKAYAKLYGSYENLDGGSTAEALEDFTGGLTESFDLKKTDRATILAMLVRGFQMGSLFGCSIGADPSVKEAKLTNGLVRGHAYSMTALRTVNTYRGETVLLRIRNPWGNSTEWNGPWSDGSEQWNDVSEEERQNMQVTFSKDGEFWMSFDDFMREYEEMEVCNLSAEIMNEICSMTGVGEQCDSQIAMGTSWKEVQEDGVWSNQDNSAGGCANNPMTYWQNPQFGSQFTVTDASVEHDGKCTVIVAVLQKYRRELRVEGKDSLPIGFSVYEAPSQPYAMDMQFFRSNRPVARVPVYINLREVTVRFRIPPGSYVIVPSTFEAHSEADFLMRVYANGDLTTTRLTAAA